MVVLRVVVWLLEWRKAAWQLNLRILFGGLRQQPPAARTWRHVPPATTSHCKHCPARPDWRVETPPVPLSSNTLTCLLILILRQVPSIKHSHLSSDIDIETSLFYQTLSLVFWYWYLDKSLQSNTLTCLLILILRQAPSITYSHLSSNIDIETSPFHQTLSLGLWYWYWDKSLWSNTLTCLLILILRQVPSIKHSHLSSDIDIETSPFNHTLSLVF